MQLLPSIEIGATHDAAYTMIWLHGLGANGNDFVPIVSEMGLPPEYRIRYVFPHAPHRAVTINQGMQMPAWYDITGLEIGSRLDKEGMLDSSNSIHRLIDEEIKRGIGSEKIFIAGFSQGAAMSLLSGLSYEKKLGGIIALSGYYPPIMSLAELTKPANRELPIFIGHGTQDMTVPILLGRMTEAFISKTENPLTFKTYPIGHTVSPEEVEDIKSWLKPKLGV